MFLIILTFNLIEMFELSKFYIFIITTPYVVLYTLTQLL